MRTHLVLSMCSLALSHASFMRPWRCWTQQATNKLGRCAVADCAGTSPPWQQARSPAERALSVRVLGFGCGADYLEGPVSSTPPDFAVPQARLVLPAACSGAVGRHQLCACSPCVGGSVGVGRLHTINACAGACARWCLLVTTWIVPNSLCTPSMASLKLGGTMGDNKRSPVLRSCPFCQKHEEPLSPLLPAQACCSALGLVPTPTCMQRHFGISELWTTHFAGARGAR